MKCSCDMSVDTYNECGLDMVHVTYPITRKHQVCSECKCVIKPGEQYRRVKGLWNESFLTYKTCLDCANIQKMFFKYGYWHGMLFKNLKESIDEAGCDLPESCIAKLRPRAKEMVCELIERCWESQSDSVTLNLTL